MTALHLFDMDGTLMYGSSASMEVARAMGLVEEFQALELDLSAGRIDPPGYAARAHELWAELTDQHVAAGFEAAPWLAGIREVWADIRERGEYCAVISLSPSFFVRRLTTWGAHAAHGSVFPEAPFLGAALEASGILLPESKVAVADELCARFGLTRAECVAYGDSMSDAPLFGVLEATVAVNADHHVSEPAACTYTGRDLREAYELARALMPV